MDKDNSGPDGKKITTVTVIRTRKGRRTITAPVTLEELEQIEAAANEAGLSRAEYVRRRCLRQQKFRQYRLAAARAKGTHTSVEWAEMVLFFGLCVRCGQSSDKLSKDHIIPIYQGGSDAISNLQPLCKSCNASKGPDSTDLRGKWINGRSCPASWKIE